MNLWVICLPNFIEFTVEATQREPCGAICEANLKRYTEGFKMYISNALWEVYHEQEQASPGICRLARSSVNAFSWSLSAGQAADFIFANHHETQNTAKSDESLERLLFWFWPIYSLLQSISRQGQFLASPLGGFTQNHNCSLQWLFSS